MNDRPVSVIASSRAGAAFQPGGQMPGAKSRPALLKMEIDLLKSFSDFRAALFLELYGYCKTFVAVMETVKAISVRGNCFR